MSMRSFSYKRPIECIDIKSLIKIVTVYEKVIKICKINDFDELDAVKSYA